MSPKNKHPNPNKRRNKMHKIIFPALVSLALMACNKEAKKDTLSSASISSSTTAQSSSGPAKLVAFEKGMASGIEISICADYKGNDYDKFVKETKEDAIKENLKLEWLPSCDTASLLGICRNMPDDKDPKETGDVYYYKPADSTMSNALKAEYEKGCKDSKGTWEAK
jgi:hypothetical protein